MPHDPQQAPELGAAAESQVRDVPKISTERLRTIERVRWLASLPEGTFDGWGRLARDLKDPQTGEVHTVATDVATWRTGEWILAWERRARRRRMS